MRQELSANNWKRLTWGSKSEAKCNEKAQFAWGQVYISQFELNGTAKIIRYLAIL